MYILVLWIITVIFVFSAFQNQNHRRAEWFVLLILLSMTKTMICYLFAAGTIFTVVTLGSIQVHLDDIILIWLMLFCLYAFCVTGVRKSRSLAATLLLILPIFVSLLRGALAGTIGSSGFLEDTRKFIVFLVTLMAAFLVFSDPGTPARGEKMSRLLARFMNCSVIYILFVWVLDLVFGFHSLPGQINGTLSDGGSTLRMVNPPQVLIIAFYTLYLMYQDLKEQDSFGLRTLLFAAVVVLLQWRTVVAAFFAGAAILILLYFLRERRLSRRLMLEAAGVLGMAVFLLLFSGGSGIGAMVQNLFTSFSSVLSGTGTFSTRISIWTEFLGSLKGINILLGQPFGYVDSSLTWTASAHSGYVDYIMVAGYIGVACLILFMIFFFKQCRQRENAAMAAMGISLMVYWIGYGFSIEQAALLGALLGILETYPRWLSPQSASESLTEEVSDGEESSDFCESISAISARKKVQ